MQDRHTAGAVTMAPIDPEIAAALATAPLDVGALFADLSDATLPHVRATAGRAPAVAPNGAMNRSEMLVPGTDGVIVRVHRPIDAPHLLPAMYWMHGGGFILGTARGDDGRFDRWCALGAVGVSVEYRLAPEHRFPDPFEDCYAGLAWVYEHAADLGIDRGRVGVGGASAGGNLAAALCLAARDRGGPHVAFQLLLYPALDDRQMTRSSQWPDPVYPPAANTYGWTAYLGEAPGGPDVAAYAAPARAQELVGLPPALIAVGGLDPFSDEAIDYAVRLRHAGNAVDLHVYGGAPHGFDRIAPQSSVAIRANRDIEEWLGRHLRRSADAAAVA